MSSGNWFSSEKAKQKHWDNFITAMSGGARFNVRCALFLTHCLCTNALHTCCTHNEYFTNLRVDLWTVKTLNVLIRLSINVIIDLESHYNTYCVKKNWDFLILKSIIKKEKHFWFLNCKDNKFVGTQNNVICSTNFGYWFSIPPFAGSFSRIKNREYIESAISTLCARGRL